MFKFFIFMSVIFFCNIASADIPSYVRHKPNIVKNNNPIKIKHISYSPYTYIPTQAIQYFPLIKKEVNDIFPDFPLIAYFPALIEQESCITLRHPKCWNPRAELRTRREYGAGLSQITKAYKNDGTIRFDTLSDLKSQYSKDLKDLNWDNMQSRPDLQIRALILLTKNNYRGLFSIKDPVSRLHMTDAAYNGGIGGLRKERTACGLATNCDAQVWANNVERYCLKSKKILYDSRNACDINREHVRTTFGIRLSKYYDYFK